MDEDEFSFDHPTITEIPNDFPRPRINPWEFLILWTALISFLTARFGHFSAPMELHWAYAKEFAANGRISETFVPGIYPALLGIGLNHFSIYWVRLVHTVFYLFCVLSAYAISRLLRLRRSQALGVAVFTSLCPDLVESINKVWDVSATCAVTMVLVVLILMVLQSKSSPWILPMIGVCLGFGMSLRPNFPTLLIPIAVAVWFGTDKRVLKFGTSLLEIIALSGVVFVCLAVFAHGRPYLPSNGPYNFFAGANQYTEQSLLNYENAEPSIIPALQQGIGLEAVHLDLTDQQTAKIFTKLGLRFVKEHPLRWGLRYSILKLFAMFRPNTKVHGLFSIAGLLRLLTTLGLPVWMTVFALRWKQKTVELQDWMIPIAAVAYVLPFILTNGDPRFGVPLLLLLWIHALALLDHWQEQVA